MRPAKQTVLNIPHHGEDQAGTYVFFLPDSWANSRTYFFVQDILFPFVEHDEEYDLYVSSMAVEVDVDVFVLLPLFEWLVRLKFLMLEE